MYIHQGYKFYSFWNLKKFYNIYICLKNTHFLNANKFIKIKEWKSRNTYNCITLT